MTSLIIVRGGGHDKNQAQITQSLLSLCAALAQPWHSKKIDQDRGALSAPWRYPALPIPRFELLI
jgi:hypothetical protein